MASRSASVRRCRPCNRRQSYCLIRRPSPYEPHRQSAGSETRVEIRCRVLPRIVEFALIDGWPTTNVPAVCKSQDPEGSGLAPAFFVSGGLPPDLTPHRRCRSSASFCPSAATASSSSSPIISFRRVRPTRSVLDEGRIVGVGSHEALSAECSLYQALWRDYVRIDRPPALSGRSGGNDFSTC